MWIYGQDLFYEVRVKVRTEITGRQLYQYLPWVSKKIKIILLYDNELSKKKFYIKKKTFWRKR